MKCFKRMKEVLKSWRLSDYFRQLSTVVIGVLITFWGSDLVSQHARQNEIRSVMQLIAQELQDNQETLQIVSSNIRNDIRMSQILLKENFNLDAIPADTISKYNRLFTSTSTLYVLSDALEVLKNSSLMQHIPNKQLLRELLWTYNRLYELQNTVRSYYGWKDQIIKESVSRLTQEQSLVAVTNMNELQHFMLKQTDFIMFVGSVEGYTN